MKSFRARGAMLFTVLILFLFHEVSAQACTAFAVKAQDGGVVTGRSYDYSRYTGFKTKIYKPGKRIKSVYTETDDSKPFSWKIRQKFITVNNVLSTPAGYLVAFEGMNRAGICISGNLADAEYPQDNPQYPTLSSDDVVRYVLSQAASLEDIKRLLSRVNIVSRWKYHYIAFDGDGNSLVTEFRGGKAVFFENQTTILTNNPNLDFQKANLNNYANLKIFNEHAITPGSGNQFHGAGMYGLPGDWMSPSRFARGHFMIQEGQNFTETTREALNLAAHIIDSVSLIKGIDTGSSPEGRPIYTQIQILKDVTNHTLYLKTYDEFQWRKVSF